ncbi:MAG: transglycosylase SLT domain-containing protein [Sulfuricellaceae bacterium]|nr:transglycosylase SLT domain-containing protein [Sulfuricellaceae bacterium]
MQVSAGQDEDFLQAREAFRKGDAARLNMLAGRLESSPFWPYVAYYQLHMRLREADPAEIRVFMADHADSLVSDKLRADWLGLLGRQQDWAAFLLEYPRLVNNRDGELECYSLQARRAQGDDAVQQDARARWFRAAELNAACAPVYGALVDAGALSQADVWARVRMALELGKVSVAQQAAEYLPAGQRVGLKDLDRAASDPKRYLDKKTGDMSVRAQREVAMFAVYRVAKNKLSDALPYWDRLRPKLGEEDLAYVWGQLAFHAARNHDLIALKWFRAADGVAFNELQLSWRVRAALRASDWELVLSGIQAMPEAMQAQGVWRYWKAHALKIQNRLGEANAILAPLSLEHNFYGQLALESLGSVVSNPPVSYTPDERALSAMSMTPGIQRALSLYDLDLRVEANREWLWVIRGFDDKKLLAAAEIARRHGWIDRAINTADKTRELHDFNLRYPSPLREQLQAYAREQDLDEAWVYGLIRQESRFVQQAKSNVGAAGLMQVMPSTAQWIAKRMGLRSYQKHQINEIDTNLSFGTYYLRHVLDSNDGQAVLATASYNAGPGRARRWKDVKSLEGAIYVESIPFTETRDYVQKVMSNASYYSNRFGNPVIPLKQRLGMISPKPSGETCAGQNDRSPSCEPD